MQYYIQEKAKKFRTSGYLLYRNQDFFHLPPVDLSPVEHQALYDICDQVIEGKGFSSYYPISVSLAHMQLFMEMLHFRITAQSEEAVQIQHILNKHKPELIYCIFTDTAAPIREPFPFSWQNLRYRQTNGSVGPSLLPLPRQQGQYVLLREFEH